MIISACAPPSCSCPEVEFTQDIDGNNIAVITDDFGGVVYMTKAEFDRIVYRYNINRMSYHGT